MALEKSHLSKCDTERAQTEDSLWVLSSSKRSFKYIMLVRVILQRQSTLRAFYQQPQYCSGVVHNTAALSRGHHSCGTRQRIYSSLEASGAGYQHGQQLVDQRVEDQQMSSFTGPQLQIAIEALNKCQVCSVFYLYYGQCFLNM
jgi:hypothetical protein